jgi:hypothetical protein
MCFVSVQGTVYSAVKTLMDPQVPYEAMNFLTS